MIEGGEATEHYDEERACPYIVTQRDEWVGYDDVRSVKAKAAWAKSKGLIGTMVWALDLDDFAGTYSNGVKYPLINAIFAGWAEGSLVPAPAPTPTVVPTPVLPTPAPTPTPPG